MVLLDEGDFWGPLTGDKVNDVIFRKIGGLGLVGRGCGLLQHASQSVRTREWSQL